MRFNFIHRCLTPGYLSPSTVLVVSVLVMLVVFVLDVITPADIRLHTLYIFPLAAIALHCDSRKCFFGGLVLSVVFQLSNFVFSSIVSVTAAPSV